MARKFIVIHTDMGTHAMSVGPFIVTGRYFKLLREAQAHAVISHEMGHITHRHALRRIWWLLSFQWEDMAERCKRQEFEADLFAVSRGHGRGLLDFLHGVQPHFSPLHPTQKERIAAILKAMGVA